MQGGKLNRLEGEPKQRSMKWRTWAKDYLHFENVLSDDGRSGANFLEDELAG